MKRKVTIFAAAITVLLLIALTMNSVSAESKAEVNLDPTDAAKVKLNPSDAANVELNPSEPMTFPTERGLNELIYDDGTAEGANAWTSAGNGLAVRFTPLSYPGDLLTARICFRPDWPDSNHEEFAVYVYDDDGPSGEPGTCLGGPISHTATAWGWCDVDISGLGITIENGDFYILYKQLTDYPNCEGFCRDLSLPQYGRSWDYYQGSWDLWDENYMIRCVVDDSSAKAKWTFMVYLDGDNDVETYAIGDFLDMSSVGSTSDVNIVVQFDRREGFDFSYGDWKTCKRFFVTPGMTPTPANALTDLGECNMGHPNTLSDFVDWAVTQYPADNYALILWDHGSGWKEKGWVPWNDNTGIARGICWDDFDGDHLTLQQTEQALAGKPISLIGYMACLMHMIENVYPVGNAGISVGSEESIWEPAWPFDTILNDLTGTPTMTSRTFGETIVSDFRGHNTWAESTLSAVEVGGVSSLVTAVDNLAQVLHTKIPGNYDEIQQARNEVEEFADSDYIDLYHFAELIELYVPGTSTAAQAVMNNINNAVYAESHRSAHPDAHGLTIYFPETEAAYLTSYENTNFAVDTHWDEFLKEYYAPTICGNMNVNPTSWSPTLNCSESDSQIVTVSATGGTVEGVTVSKVSGPTWLSVSPTNLGDIASGSSKAFTVTAAPPAGTSGDFTYTVRVSNTCGTPSTRDVSGTIHVDCPESSWTFMIYLDGDNNLESAAIDDFMEMSSVGSTSDVNTVVQFDRIPGYDSSYGDWRDCKRFLVTQGMTPTAANALMDLGECNMGDHNTLRDFVEWTMTEFPADNYALILWNHGGGWKSINKWVPWADDIKDAKDAGFTRGICWDDTNNDYLSLQETEQALTGKYVQLLGYDACLMHMVEVVYQVMANAGVSVGSEEVEQWDGWPYDTILTDLTGTPSMSPSILGETIVSRYIESCAYGTYETQSAVDKAKVSNLASAVDTLAQVLIDKLPDDYAKIQQARNGVEEFYYPDYIDLYHLAELIKSYLSDNPAAVAAAQAVMGNVDNTVTAEGHGTTHPNAHGLSIYFPEAEWAYLSSYENTKFAVDTHWDEFLKEYYAPSKPDLIITEKWVCWPDNCTICYNVTNTGDGTAPSGHNTALYVDDVELAHDHVPVDLAPGESYSGYFNGYVWTYTPPSDDITVCADNNEALDELHETNNCLTNIWMCGDVTGDGRVRTSDGRRIFRHLTFGDPIDNMWAADVTGDGRVRTSDGRRIFRHLTFGDPLNCKCSG